MSRIALGLVLLAACCKSSPSGAPLTAEQVTGELVDAGCLAPGSSDAIAAELAGGKDTALMVSLQCLVEGGTVAGCGVPCTRLPRPAP